MSETTAQQNEIAITINQLESMMQARKIRLGDVFQQRLRLVRNFCYLLAGIIFLSGGWQTWQGIQLNGQIPFGTYASSVLILIALGISFLTQRKTNKTQLDIASYILCISLMAVLSALLATLPLLSYRDVLFGSLFALPVAAGLLGLQGRHIFIIGFLTLLSTLVATVFGNYILHTPGYEVLDLAFAYYLNIVFIFLAISYGVFVFTQRIFVLSSDLEQQAAGLTRLLVNLNSTNEFGVNLGRELSTVATELKGTSTEHAAYTQEQVASITEVTTSLEELSETANQIANSATSASVSARKVLALATEVQQASELAEFSSQEGTKAVEDAVVSVERVRNRIELLGQRLLNLTEQTRRVGAIIDIIDEIADETHLLALNASIEAAGNVQTNAATNSSSAIRSERFGVIAQEVKNLSDRSRESTEEVRQAISEMQGAVAAAVLVAEEGKKDTAAALSRSEIAGSVIDKLNQVITASSSKATNIVDASEEVKIRCEEISLATGQQRSANQQILMTMRNVTQLSQQNAGTVYLLSESAAKITTHVQRINRVLTRTLQPDELSPVA